MIADRDSGIKGRAWFDQHWNVLHMDVPSGETFFFHSPTFMQADDLWACSKEKEVPVPFVRLATETDWDEWHGFITSGTGSDSRTVLVTIQKMRGVDGGSIGYILTLNEKGNDINLMAACDAMERGVTFLDHEGKVLHLNACARTRSTAPIFETIGIPIWDGQDWRNLREEREQLISHFRQATESAVSQHLILKQGRRFSNLDRSIVYISLTPIRADHGGISQVIMDEWYIPLKVQTEIRTRMSESVFRSFLDQCPLPAWMVDNHGKLIALSKTYADMFGLVGDDIGKDMMQLIPSRFVLQYTKHHEKVLISGESLHVVENWVGPDGRVRTYIVHKFPIRTERTITMIGSIAFEVTEKLRMEEEFKDSHELFSLASEATQDLIWDWDINADKIRTHGDPEVIWRDEEEQMYSSTNFFGKMHPDDRERVEELLKNALADPGTERVQGVYRFKIDGGHYVLILDRARILRDEHGRPYRVVGSAMRLSGELQRSMRMVPIQEEKIPEMGAAKEMSRNMKWTEGEHFEYAIRRALAMADPVGRITTGISIVGMDKAIMDGFDVGPMMTVIGRFFDTVIGTGPVRNLSLYIWTESERAWLRVAHDGNKDWHKDAMGWLKGLPGATLHRAETKEGGQVRFSFPMNTNE